MDSLEELQREQNNPHVFMDIAIGEEKAGRVVIELFRNVVPKTVDNFRLLCTGQNGIGKLKQPLHYKGSIFHRVVPQFMVQGGDIVNFDGTGGESIYGLTFEDENFTLTVGYFSTLIQLRKKIVLLQHSTEGAVGMANCGPNSNSSQFYITTVPCSHLDGINVLIGKVVKGINIIKEMQAVPKKNDSPLKRCEIIECGEFKPGELWNIGENDGTRDVYPAWPDDCDMKNFPEFINTITNIKESGNFYYSNQDYVRSDKKYKKALRYINWWLSQNKNSKLMKEMKVVTIVNLAAASLKRNDYYEVIKLCTQALQIDPINFKALYRRGKAKMGINEYNEAIQDFAKALKQQPNSKHLLNEIECAKNYKKSYIKKEREFFSKLF